MTTHRKITHAEWRAEGERRFGKDAMKWRFVCPVCSHVASTQDWKDAGAKENHVAFSCIGRWLPEQRDAFEAEGKGPCNYAGGGLFKLNPLTIVTADGQEHTLFEFAGETP